MKLRRLTPAGIAAFGGYLDALEHEPTRLVPSDVLNDPRLSEPLPVDVEITQQQFGSRFAAAEYFDNRFSDAGLGDTERDAGLWSWLALFYFDQVCPLGPNGERSPGERARYILDPANYRRYYRHLLAGPYRIYRAHRKNPGIALAVLCQPLDKPGEIVEQLASRQELVTNPAVMAAATILYIDKNTRRPKPGVQTKSETKGGGPRRLAVVLNQFDVTWDLYAMQANELLNVLPAEFRRFSSHVSEKWQSVTPFAANGKPN
jgi:hypothetical protein